MNHEQIRELLANPCYEDTPPPNPESDSTRLIETHISFVIMGNTYVYKLKKTIRVSFLDFSTLEKRRFYCFQELNLNRRLAHNMYLDVLPVVRTPENNLCIGQQQGEIIDYALKMNRMDSSKEMHRLLEQKVVEERHIRALANKIIPFHQQAEVINLDFSIDQYKERFNRIVDIKPVVQQHLGQQYNQLIDQSVRWSDRFLHNHAGVIERRHRDGLVRDCHGDLHSKNIFLYEDPVIFDCIEFNTDFRYSDVLNDVAYLCMDLDMWGRPDLSDLFYSIYSREFSGQPEPDADTRRLYNYYKCFRANVRAKVNAMNAKELEEGPQKQEHLLELKKYLELMGSYMDREQ